MKQYIKFGQNPSFGSDKLFLVNIWQKDLENEV